MLTQRVYDSTRLPGAVWQLFFNNVELFFDNVKYVPSVVNLRSGGTIKKITIGHYTYLEQNPHSTSEYGRLARAGHKILWIIHFPTDRYVGRVVDGKVTQIR